MKGFVQTLDHDLVVIEGSQLPAPIVSFMGGRRWELEAEYVFRDEASTIIVRKGFEFDLSSIPRFLWWLIAPFELSVTAPLIHDFLYHFGGAPPDYTGHLRATWTMRITDRNNGAPAGEAATVEDIPYKVDATCAATADQSIGASCAVTTTFNALAPGTIKDGKRAIFQLGRIEVYDGGPDGDVVSPDNALLATQGVFVP